MLVPRGERMIRLKNDTEKRITRPRNRKWLRVVPIVAVTVLASLMLFPVTAHAETPDLDIFNLGMTLKNYICYILLEGACALLNCYNYVIGQITAGSILTMPFDSVLGTDMYNLTKTVYDVAVVPLAESILALFMLVQLVKISQRIDATSTLPAVKEIVFLMVVYVLLHWFIVNALDVMQAIYQIVADSIIPNITGSTSITSVFAGDFSTEPIAGSDWDNVAIGEALLVLVVSFFALIVGFAAYIIALVVSYARAWQIYVYAAFSAIPVSLLGFDETRQMGISFIKNFASACLAGAVLMFLFVAYPYILSGSLDASSFSILDFVVGTEGLIVLLKFLAISILFIFGIIKSGAWAKEILGG